MNRQYIGARYVPIYFNNNGSAEWVEGISYEPLTIVKYLDRTYTSTKPVPSNVGSPNVNTEYWVESGDTQTLNNLINAIEDVDTKVDNLKDSTDDEFESINGSIDEIENDIDLINVRIGANRKYLFVGDSYSLMNVGWLNKLVSLMALTSNDYYTACVSGSSFTSQNPNYNWQNIVANTISSLTTDEKALITDVVCIGGINDSLPYTEFPDCNNQDDALVYTVNKINEFAIYVASNLPNAKISLFYVGNTEEGMDTEGQRYYANIVRTIAAWNNASYWNLKNFKGAENILHIYSLMSADGIHPNENGCIMIARYVNNCLMGGNGVDIVDGYNTGLTITTTTGGDASNVSVYGTLKCLIINGYVNISGNGIAIFELDNTTSYSDGDTLVLGAFNNTNMIHGKSVEIPCVTHYIISSSTSATLTNSVLIVDKGILKLKINKINNNWGGVQSTTFANIIIEIPNTTYSLVQN